MSGSPRSPQSSSHVSDCGPPKRKLSDHRPDAEKRPRHVVDPFFPAGVLPPPPPPSVGSRPPVRLPLPPPLGGRPPPPPLGMHPPTLPPPLASAALSTERVAPPPVKPAAVPLAFKKSSKPLAIKLGAPKPSTSSESARPKVAAIFGDDDDDDDVEEMPTDAKMRMRNVGRETITSSGPNSFGKTRQGFVDSKRLFERQLQKAMEDVCEENKK